MTEQSVAMEDPGVQGRLGDIETQFSDLRRQVQRLQKLAALGTMSTILAHEFNNIMTPVVGYADYALQHRGPDQMITALEKTLMHSRRAVALCHKILGLATDNRMGSVATLLRPLVQDAVDCLARDLDKDGIDVEIDVPESLSARVHAASIQQVLFNLILNARQAMLGRRGRLTITAVSETRQGDAPAEPAFVLLCVRDTGPGVRQEAIEQIFEPFFSTKSHVDRPDRQGVGLGLTISRQLIEEQGGRLTVESRYGHGATFTLHLPSAE